MSRTAVLFICCLVTFSFALSAKTVVYPVYENGVYLGCTFLNLDTPGLSQTVSPAVVGADECVIIAELYNQFEQPAADVNFTAGVSLDGLSNPVYSVEPFRSPDTPEQRFRILEDRDARDSSTVGIAVISHLVVPRLRPWAPLSLGLGIGEHSSFRLLVGTSLQVEDRLFITVGAAIGKVARLPANLRVGSVTTDPNAVVDLPLRNDSAWFVALAYRLGR